MFRITVPVGWFVFGGFFCGSRRFWQVHQPEFLRLRLSRKHSPQILGTLPRYCHTGFLPRRWVGRGTVQHAGPFLECCVPRLPPDHPPNHLWKHRSHSRIPTLADDSGSAFASATGFPRTQPRVTRHPAPVIQPTPVSHLSPQNLKP